MLLSLHLMLAFYCLQSENAPKVYFLHVIQKKATLSDRSDILSLFLRDCFSRHEPLSDRRHCWVKV